MSMEQSVGVPQVPELKDHINPADDLEQHGLGI